MLNPEKPRLPRALIVAVQLDGVSDTEFNSSLVELAELAKTLGLEVVGQFTQKRASFDSAAYIGVGKREEIRQFVQGQQEASERLSQADAGATNDAVEFILVDHEISPSQALNLENEVGCEVMDRTVVILEIFHRNASSHAARIQVEIARLTYMAPRLREAAKREGPSGRQRSGTGGRGSGQSRSEMDSRKVRDRIAELQKEIDAMEAGRETQRAQRQGQTALAQVALVGYTNAGKSTLMRALTGKDVLVANKLFATLDTKVRTLHPETVPKVLVSDTVGFIKNLPHGLVTVSADENADLFWALRGGKSGLGIVTEVRVELVELPELYAGSLLFEAEHIERVLRGWLGYTRVVPDGVSTSIALLSFPPIEQIPEPMRGKQFASVRFAFPGGEAEGERLAAPLRGLAPVFEDEIRPLAIVDIGLIHNDPQDPGPSWADGTLLARTDAADSDEELADALLAAVGPGVRAPFIGAELRHLRGSARTDQADDSAVGGRDATFSLLLIGVPDPGLFETVLPAAAGGIFASLRPWLNPVSNVNWSAQGLAGTPNWSPAVAERLAAVRASYDPDHVFAP